jgi:N-carbamoyl-L-amino-acid hydrolase
VQKIWLDHGEEACATVGILDVMPHSRNVIPGRCFLTIDLRHPAPETLELMEQRLSQAVGTIAKTTGLEIRLEEFWRFPSTPFAPQLVEEVRSSARRRGYSHRDIVAGAGHDAVYVAGVVPTAMIFIPCEGGLSHNEAENITPADAGRGATVLFDAVLATAQGA